MGNITIDILNKMVELGELSGLTFANEINEDGLPIFIGTQKEWEKYDKLLKSNNIKL